jgi:DNA-binding transcriptional ArsR family regulator
MRRPSTSPVDRQILDALSRHSLSARELQRLVGGVSQPTVSRAISRLGGRVRKFGAARATRYAATRDVRQWGSDWPLYRIDTTGAAIELGRLSALNGGEYLLEPRGQRLASLFRGEFTDGLFPDLPWPLMDVRPQGFLGRAFARRHGAALGLDENPERWSGDQALSALLRHGEDMPGDLVLGEFAMRSILQARLSSDGTVIPAHERVTHYAQLAERAMQDDFTGSSAGGEQPKFTARIREANGSIRSVLVKFTEASNTTSKRRWVDLLVCEHLALEVLRAAGLPAATSELVIAGERLALEVTRFDRVGEHGRRGCVSLAAVDDAWFGKRDRWTEAAARLESAQLLAPEDARRLQLEWWFGALIANSDMHFGNTSLFFGDELPFALAPVYDMLPMLYRPGANGELIAREFTAPVPTPEHLATWRIAATLATRFWTAAAEDRRISPPFREIASSNRDAVLRARAVIG